MERQLVRLHQPGIDGNPAETLSLKDGGVLVSLVKMGQSGGNRMVVEACFTLAQPSVVKAGGTHLAEGHCSHPAGKKGPE